MSRRVDGARLLRLEERTLLLLYVVSGALLSTAFAAPYLMALPTLAVLVWVPLRRIDARAPAWVEGLMALMGAIVAAPIGYRNQSAALGLSAFLFVIMGVRLVAPRSDRERATTAAVGVVLAAVAASEAVEPAFALLLFLSLGLQLVFLHLRNQRFRGALDHRQDAAGVTGPRLIGPREPAPPAPPNRVFAGRPPLLRRLAAWGVITATVLGVTVAFFLLTPRLGARFLAQRKASAAQRLSGFSGRVGLDDIGRIRLNPRVAFRVEVPRAPQSEEEQPYWRGRALDLYWHGNWNISPWLKPLIRGLNNQGSAGFVDPIFQRENGRVETERYTFYVEPLGTRALFCPAPAERFTFEGGQPRDVRVDPLQNYTTAHGYLTNVTYSVEVAKNLGQRRHHSRRIQRQLEHNSLRIPPQLDRARLEALAQELKGPRLDPRTQPRLVMHALADRIRRGWRYTLQATRTPDTEPLEDFLYHKRQGHCELFASAQVMLLRSLGIPARLVTGFYGGEYDAWSQSYTVRQSSAHAWVEVWVGDGWERCDPTPPEARVPEASMADRLRASLNWLELRWFNYVISFDAYDQQRWMVGLRAKLDESGGLQQVALRGLPWLIGGLALVCGLVWLWRRRGARKDDVPAPLRRLLRALARRGYPRRRGETLLELAQRAEPALGTQGALERCVRGYYAERFGAGGSEPPAELAQVVANLESGPPAGVA
ncbi:MAG TPA: hypothetical protein DEA08_31065 [Planctomycetes bacterium]|nr:hypothetical protein [Planctomycetota bacterium]